MGISQDRMSRAVAVELCFWLNLSDYIFQRSQPIDAMADDTLIESEDREHAAIATAADDDQAGKARALAGAREDADLAATGAATKKGLEDASRVRRPTLDCSRMRPVSALDYYGVGQDPCPPDDVEAQEYKHSRALGGAASLVLTESPRRAQGQLDRGGLGGASESAAARLLLGADAADGRPLHLRCFPTCDWETRVMGFLSCFAIGLALSLSSLFSFPLILVGDPGPFAWKYSIGNLVSLASSVFLVGLRTQCELMASPVRIGASAAYVLSIAVTIIAALMLENALITIIAMLIQFCALAWYCASFIPFGRSMIRKCVGRYCCAV